MAGRDVLIIGAGLTGLVTGWQCALAGKKPRIIAKGWGTTHWHAGCIDVLGYYPLDAQTAVSSPADALQTLITQSPNHPYALVGVETIRESLTALQTLFKQTGYPLHGSLDKNWLLPSAVGTFRPTCLAPETMIAGDLSHAAPMLIVGLRQFVDFYPNVIADNLTQQGIPARHVTLDLPTLAERNFNTAVSLATLLETADFRRELALAIMPYIGNAERIGLPAILGLNQPLAVLNELSERLGKPVFEIPGLPPSIPGMRLHAILKRAIEQHGGTIYSGMLATSSEKSAGKITAVLSQTSGRPKRHPFASYLLATGGVLGGGIRTSPEGTAKEVVFDLPINLPNNRLAWYRREFLHKEGHPIYQTGVRVDENFQPVGENGRLYDNLFAAGATLAHCEPIRERSVEGIALATAFAAAKQI